MAKGLSQEALGEELDLHRTYVGSIERGERNITLRTLESWADRLGVDPLSLLQPAD
jgi:transcriptional regulator with XRE-family HTH domain